ncbi:hypothetical protein Mapa_014126 [Marchantia paleacea]|nr:hypothetical protein Mapa_014126 [Marchantia paleacea]
MYKTVNDQCVAAYALKRISRGLLYLLPPNEDPDIYKSNSNLERPTKILCTVVRKLKYAPLRTFQTLRGVHFLVFGSQRAGSKNFLSFTPSALYLEPVITSFLRSPG